MISQPIHQSKQQLLERRINNTNEQHTLANETSNSNTANITNETIDINSDQLNNKSDSKTDDVIQTRENSFNRKTDDLSLSICETNLMHPTEITFAADTNSNVPQLITANSSVTTLQAVVPSSCRQISHTKRHRKSKVDSPNIKKFCTHNDTKIDKIFKVQANQLKILAPPSEVKTINESSVDSVHDNVGSISEKKNTPDKVKSNISSIDYIYLDNVETKRILKSLEQENENIQRENKKLMEEKKSSHEFFSKILIKQAEQERRATEDRMAQNTYHLGQYKHTQAGMNHKEKWCEGVKYQDLEKRKKLIEKQKEDNEKNKKTWNKLKKSKQFANQYEINEFCYQGEIFDIFKLNIEKEEKEIQAEVERFDLERNLHIREIKRLNNQEASRFRDFPILHDRYQILSLLGKGGFSEVHKGYDLERQCYVACKIHELRTDWNQDKKDSYIRHALREISIHKSLDHKRIVKVHDVFNIDNDAFCTVLECCEGNDLDFFLKQNKCIPEREAKSIICQLVSALRYLNDRKNPIIHYDLKPGNILLDNSREIKITDFGLSKIFPDDHDDADGMELTSQGAGTYWYLPPECFVTDNGPPTISNKVDVWSVGVIFFQTLYGIKPFGNNMTQTDILHSNTILQARSINFPSNPKVSDAAKDFMRRCCTYDKRQRPDVFRLCEDDYLKPKAQLKNIPDVAHLNSAAPQHNN